MRHTTKRPRRQRARSRAAMMGALMAGTAFGAEAAAAPLATPGAGAHRGPAIAGLVRPKTVYEAVIGDVLRAMRTSTAEAAQARAAQQFDIAPGPLATALASFEAVTKISVEIATDTAGAIHSGGATGLLTPEQALQRLLAGTGLAHRFVSPTVVRIDLPQQRYTVEVIGWTVAEVESPKFTAPLIDMPQSVSIVPREVFEQQGARNLTEVLRNAPGITFNAGENGFATGTANFSLRGFDTSGSVFIDNARDSGNYLRDVFNAEQVEVVKGPSGDNGRSSAGGYINTVTKTPQAANFQGGTVGYGFDAGDSANRPRVTFDVNRQLAAGAAVRVNALWQDGGVPGRSTAEMSSWGLAPSVGFGLNGPTQLVVAYQHVDQSDRPDWGTPGALVEGMITYNAAAGGTANRSRFYGHESDYDNVTSDSALARVEHAFANGARLSNQTRWANTEREALYTVPTAFVPATGLVGTQRQGFSRDNSTVSNLTNLSVPFATGSLRHSVATGIEFSADHSSADRYPTNGVLGNPGSVPVDNPDPTRALTGLVGLVPVQTADVRVGTMAAYAYDTVELSPRWQATGGIRVEQYHVTLDSRTAAGAPQGPDSYDRRDTTFGGKAGLVFKPADAGSIYGAVGVAALPPASYLSNPDISREGDNAFPGWSAGQNSETSDVQRSTNYELGTKWNLFDDGRLNTTVALFRTERRNIAMAGTVDGVPNTFAGNASQVVQGVEFGVSGRLTTAWSVFGGLLLMDSERRHGIEVDEARRAANPGDYGDKTTTNGDQLAFTPNTTLSLWTTYSLPFNVTLGGGVRYVGDSYLGRPDDAERIIPNGNAGKLPAHSVVDLLAIYTVNQRLNLRFNADNLTNAFYPISANWAGSRVTLGPARSFVLSTDLRF